MKSREEYIEFEMNYCQHYMHGKGADMVCAAGMDLKTTQIVRPKEGGMKWGPCIEGHLLPDPKAHCPHWIRRTREMGEKRADGIQKTLDILEKSQPFISQWRAKEPRGKREVVVCPVCGNKLHLSQSSYKGHVRALCETADCINFIE